MKLDTSAKQTSAGVSNHESQTPNSTVVVIRELRSDDRDSVSEILQSSAAFTAEEISVALELVDEAITHGVNGDYVGFVATRGSTIAGYICLGKASLTASSWYIYWICVDPRTERTGVGGMLESYGESFARSRGAKRLVVETSSQPGYDRAHRFYEKTGYRQVGRIPDFYKSNDDCVIYCKALT